MKPIIRSLLCIMTVILLDQCEKDEPIFNVKIPDDNFLNALIESGIDTDEDGKISYSEAESVISLDISGDSISEMTGIEKFINLDTLMCYSNQLTTLNLSYNINLEYLDCHFNQFIFKDSTLTIYNYL